MDEYTRREMLRFLSKIKTLNNGCWEWTSTINRKGYGVLSVHGKPVVAYRVSYMLFRGEIPPAMQIDHICHNRACVNPNHLRLATTTQNNENHTGANRNSGTGVRGVYWEADRQKYRVEVISKGKRHRKGGFSNLSDAAAYARELRNELMTFNDADRQ